MGKPYDALFALRTCYVVSTSNSNRVWLPIMFVCFVSFNCYNWYYKGLKINGWCSHLNCGVSYTIYLAHIADQNLWMFRHVLHYGSMIPLSVISAPVHWPNPTQSPCQWPESRAPLIKWPLHISVEQQRPWLGAEMFWCFIALVSSAPNPLWST